MDVTDLATPGRGHVTIANPYTVRARRHRPRASLLGQLATFGVLALALAGLDGAADSADLRHHLLLGFGALAAGAALSWTPLSRPFRLVSAWLGAIVVGGGLAFLLWDAGISDRGTWTNVGLLSVVVLGLDLRWVARLRVWVFLSGVVLVPALLAPDTNQMGFAAAWLVGVFVALRTLGVDAQRSVARPDPQPGTPRRGRRSFDLVRVLAVGLTGGIVLAALLSSPSYSFRPLERLVRYLPFKPPLDLSLNTDLDIRDYELDVNGFETRYRVDPRGRRLVVDQNGGEILAVVQRGDVDEFVTAAGDRVATMSLTDGTLTVHVDGTSTTYRRDDQGWFLDADGTTTRIGFSRDGVTVAFPDGSSAAAIGGGTIAVPATDANSALTLASGGTIAVPPTSILDGTVGRDTWIRRFGDTVEVGTFRRSYRRYETTTTGLRVDVSDRRESYEYWWNEDRSEVEITVERYGQSATLVMDRTGNFFDGLDEYLNAETGTSPGRNWRPWAQGIALGVLAGGAVLLLLRHRGRLRFGRRSTPRRWAERELARLRAFGAARGIDRRPDDTVVGYLARLDDEVDDRRGRLGAVADTLDRALFAPEPATDAARNQERTRRAAATTTIDAVLRGTGDEDTTRRPPRRARRPDGETHDADGIDHDGDPDGTAPDRRAPATV